MDTAQEIRGQVRAVPVTAITVSRHNPRRISPDDPYIETLAASMAATGLAQPVVVRVNPADSAGWELLAGSCRLMAARKLGWETIDAIVRDLDDLTAQAITVVENLQRKDLSPLEEAQGLQWLLELGEDQKAIAAKVGWPLSRVARRAQLLTLIAEWRELGKTAFPTWSAAHFELIARLPVEQQGYLARKARNEAYRIKTTSDLAKWVEESMFVLARAPFDLKDNGLSRVRGACVDCPERSSVRPELFWDEDKLPGDLKGHDRCLDRSCYVGKMKAFRDRAIAQAREQNAAVLLLSTESYAGNGDGFKPPDGTVFSYSWRKAKKADSGSMQGVIVHGSGIGQLRWVTLTSEYKRELSARAAMSGTKRPKKGERTAPTAQELSDKLKEARLGYVVEQICEALEKVDPLQLILPPNAKIWTLMPIGDQLKAIERFMRWVLLLGVELADPLTLAEWLADNEAASTTDTIRQLWKSQQASLRWWMEYMVTDAHQAQALCEFIGFLVYDDLYAAACEKFPDAPAPVVKAKGKRSSKKEQAGSLDLGTSAGATESDPLANEHGVFTKETAGDALEILTVNIPAKWKFQIELEIVKGSSGHWYYGYRFGYSSAHGSSAAPSLSRLHFESRAAALALVIEHAVTFVNGYHGAVHVPQSHRDGTMAALERFHKRHVEGGE